MVCKNGPFSPAAHLIGADIRNKQKMELRKFRKKSQVTLRQNLERAVEVPREPRVQIVGHVVGVDLDVSRRVDKHQPEISAA